MRIGKYHWCLLLFIPLLQTSGALAASNIPCEQVHASARISRAKSLKTVGEEMRKVPLGYIVEFVAAFRVFELQPGDRASAADLLKRIPSDEAQQEVMSHLAGSLCDDETLGELEALARVYYGMPRLLAKAVELAPEYMEAYVAYSLIATDPHSDYAIQMQKVCRNRRQEFTRAVAALPERDRKWFATGVFEPKSCRAIALHEAN